MRKASVSFDLSSLGSLKCHGLREVNAIFVPSVDKRSLIDHSEHLREQLQNIGSDVLAVLVMTFQYPVMDVACFLLRLSQRHIVELPSSITTSLWSYAASYVQCMVIPISLRSLITVKAVITV